jgi:hypothetical protein
MNTSGQRKNQDQDLRKLGPDFSKKKYPKKIEWARESKILSRQENLEKEYELDSLTAITFTKMFLFI